MLIIRIILRLAKKIRRINICKAHLLLSIEYIGRRRRSKGSKEGECNQIEIETFSQLKLCMATVISYFASWNFTLKGFC